MVHRDASPKDAANANPSISARRYFLNLSGELWSRLRDMALARDELPEKLASELLARGLEQEAYRTLAQTSLESLTPRERQVALLTLRGLTNRQIAAALVISPETVKTHIRHTLEKLGLRSKADLRLLLLQLGSA